VSRSMTTHKKTYLILLIGILLGFCSFISISSVLNHKELCELVFLILLPLICFLMLIYCSKSVVSLSKTPSTNIIFFLGLLIIIGGSLFDMGVTLAMSPDLALESNPVVTTMFSLGYSLGYIKLYNLILQTLFLSTMVCFLLLSCRSFRTIVNTIDKKSIFHIIPEIYCGKNKGYFDFFSYKIDPFYLNASVAPTFVGMCLFRIYCGLEWLEIVPISRIYAPIGLMLAMNIFYVVIVFRSLR